MALSANTVWEVRSGGADTNGGGFVTGASGTDWSQQNAAQYSVTDAVTNGTTTITSATANFGTDVVGNILYIQGGTGSITAGWYQITARTNSTTITVDRSTGLTTGTGATLKIGGALATPGAAALIAAGGNKVWLKLGTYTVSATITFPSFSDSAPNDIYLIGYNSTRGDNPTGSNRPTIQASGSIAGALVTTGLAGTRFFNLILDGNDLAQICGSVGGGTNTDRGTAYFNCHAMKGTVTGWNLGGSRGVLLTCTAMKAGASRAFECSSSVLVNCLAYDNPCPAFQWATNSGTTCIGCIADSNSGASSDGFGGGNALSSVNIHNCIAYNNGRHGFYVPTYETGIVRGCIAYGNGGYGLVQDGMQNTSLGWLSHDYNAFGSNTSGARSGIGAGPNDITLTADPFIDAPNGNFGLNNVSGGGALIRAASLALGSTTIGPFNPLIDIPAPAEVAAAVWGWGYRALT